MPAYDRITLENLLQSNKAELQQKQYEISIALRAIGTLEHVSQVIRQAGGGHDEKMVGNLSLGELALLFARNHIELTAKYSPPEEDKKLRSNKVPPQDEEVDRRRQTWINLLEPDNMPIAATNGYCDTCGEMYTRGWEKTHPRCRRQDTESRG